MPPIATQAVEDRVKELERENAALKKRLAELEALVRDLRARLKGVDALFHWWHRFKRGEIGRPRLQREMAAVRKRFKWLLGLHEKTESLRAQGRSILDFLEASIRARLVGGAHPSLLPTRAT